MRTVQIDGHQLTIADVVAVSYDDSVVALAPGAAERVQLSRNFIEDRIADNQLIYGINTGTGPFVHHPVPPDQVNEFQKHIIWSLFCGVGDYLPTPVARAMMLIRANSLAAGHSGIRLSTLESLLEMLNRGVHPLIPEKGSVGASGDLVPLAHMTAALMGEGHVEYRGEIMEAVHALERANLIPVQLQAKEGLALINGTTFMTAIGALGLAATDDLVHVAEACAAWSLEALHGTDEPFDARIQALRPYPGQIRTAQIVLRLVQGSRLVRTPDDRRTELERERDSHPAAGTLSRDLQDPYSLRCVPQIVGAVRDALEFVRQILLTDLNSVSDNPLIFAQDGVVRHGGNFQGHHVSMAMDVLANALTQLGILSERRLARFIDEKYSLGLPPFLTTGQPGFHCGFMGIQLMATSLVAELRLLATPASIQSVPTNANNQDVVSMGALAARRNLDIADNVQHLLAVELLALAQAAEFRGLEKFSPAAHCLYQEVRRHAARVDDTRGMHAEIRALATAIRDRSIPRVVEECLAQEPKAVGSGQ